MRRLVVQGLGRAVGAGSPVLLPDHLSIILRTNMKYRAGLTFLLGWQNLGSLQDCLLQVEDCASVEIHIDVGSTLRISDSQRSHLREWFDESGSDRIQLVFWTWLLSLTMGRLAEMQRKLLEVGSGEVPTIVDVLRSYFAANDGS